MSPYARSCSGPMWIVPDGGLGIDKRRFTLT